MRAMTKPRKASRERRRDGRGSGKVAVGAFSTKGGKGWKGLRVWCCRGEGEWVAEACFAVALAIDVGVEDPRLADC